MIRCVNALQEGLAVFEKGRFCREKWEAYIDSILPGSRDMFLSDMQACLDAGFGWEKDFLPVLSAVPGHPGLKELEENFRLVTQGLEEKVLSCFGRSVDAEIVLYLGLLGGAGWVTEVNGRLHVLLGAEKILELSWQDADSMRGLVWHELGHVYHGQWGKLKQAAPDGEKRFVWQLFTEGIAMVFEQMLAGDAAYFHQDRQGWKAWCDSRFPQILRDFAADLLLMTPQNQRYFGDWASYEGKGDAGYYLGCRFVRHLMKEEAFDYLIGRDLENIWRQFVQWTEKERV